MIIEVVTVLIGRNRISVKKYVWRFRVMVRFSEFVLQLVLVLILK